jgi:uncharacterized membrane protein
MSPEVSQPQELSARATSESTRQNIETIARLENEEMEKRALGERVSDVFTGFMGSMTFVVIHLVAFAAWFLINTGHTPLPAFDPFPFGILTLIVSGEGVLLAIFVLVSQNRMSRQANHRAHLNLQISLLAEQESTKLLQKVERILDRLGIEESPKDQAIELLGQETHLETLAEELRRKMPGE